ncbi:MAG: transporter [Thiobacillus sp.]|uniref:transporter n=1 Tax=Thiobacillus sp. TaxID=924 RepID=UPI0028946D3B|nr:transporter [Thiobacillus sp.]MDT3707791.1 transporter [Thiobacillus sp.]
MSRKSPHGWRSVFFVLAVLPTAPGFAAHPLITEDTGTQGLGNWQLELTTELGHDEVADAEYDAADIAATVSYGALDNLDLMLTLPYGRTDSKENGETTREDGLGDVGLDAKWRFFEQDRLSLALKTGATFATGDETKGLGAGKFNAGVSLITSYETEQWGAHLHLGYLQNRNIHGERDVIHHTSAALTRMATDKLKLVADLGRFTSADPSVSASTRFLTLGAIYAVRDNFDIDIGLKHGLSDPETDTTLLLGIALRS